MRGVGFEGGLGVDGSGGGREVRGDKMGGWDVWIIVTLPLFLGTTQNKKFKARYAPFVWNTTQYGPCRFDL